MPKWRNSVIPALLLSTFHLLYGQLPAPTFRPPSSELVCPATILILNNAVLSNAAPRALIVLTMDDSQPLPKDVEPAYPSDIVVTGVTVPITKTTTVRAIAVLRADSSQTAIDQVSAQSSATYTCTSSQGLTNSAQSAQALTDKQNQAGVNRNGRHGKDSTDKSSTSKQAVPAPGVASPESASAGKEEETKGTKESQPVYIRERISTTSSHWPTVLIGLVGFLLLWLCIVAITHFLQSLRIGLSGLEFLGGRSIPPPSLGISRDAANDRRRRLEGFLNEFRESAGVPIEFIDVPGELHVERRRFEQDDASRFWHASRLRLQLRSDHYLLLERVTDALVCMQKDGRLKENDFPISLRLKRTPDWLARKSLPWRVVVTTVKPRMLKKLILELGISDWLGIGIEFVKPARSFARGRARNSGEGPQQPIVQAQGRCIQGSDGLEGIVGGVVHDVHNHAFGVTCRHVLSSDCGSLYWPARPVRPPENEFTLEIPDVAFIELNSPCFANNNGSKVQAMPSTQTDIDLAAARESRVHKSPDSDGASGVVLFSNVSGFKLGNHFYRGPHFQITPAFYRRFGLTWPRFGRFSSKGDSGAWVIDAETQQWLGMVVGGFAPPNTLSVAISAEHICDAFTRLQVTANPTVANNSTSITAEVFQ
jgi:hypothetical protein